MTDIERLNQKYGIGKSENSIEALNKKYGINNGSVTRGALTVNTKTPQATTPTGSSSIADLLPIPNVEAERRNYAVPSATQTKRETKTENATNAISSKIAGIDKQIDETVNKLQGAKGREKRQLNRQLRSLRSEKEGYAKAGAYAEGLSSYTGRRFVGDALSSLQGGINHVVDMMQVGYQGELNQQQLQMQRAANLTGNENMQRTADALETMLNEQTEKPLVQVSHFGDRYNEQTEKMFPNPTNAQQIIGNIAGGVGGMVPSIVANYVAPGSGLYVMMAGAAGNATEEALKEGASDQNAIAYGVTVGAVEGLTEAMFDGVAGVFGKGAADDAVEDIVKRVIKNNPTAQNAVIKALGMLGEGTEEFTSEFADEFLKRLYVGGDARRGKELWGDAWQSFLVGAAISGVMEVSNLGLQRINPKQAAAIAADKAAAQFDANMNKYYDSAAQNGLFSTQATQAQRKASDANIRARQTLAEAQGANPVETRNANAAIINALNNAERSYTNGVNTAQTANTATGYIVLPTAAERGMLPTYAQSTELNAVVQQARENGVTRSMVNRVMNSPAMMQEIGVTKRGADGREEVRAKLESLANTESRDIINSTNMAQQTAPMQSTNVANTDRFTAVQNAAEEVANNVERGEESIRLRGSTERDAGQSAGRQSQGVESAAGGTLEGRRTESRSGENQETGVFDEVTSSVSAAAEANRLLQSGESAETVLQRTGITRQSDGTLATGDGKRIGKAVPTFGLGIPGGSRTDSVILVNENTPLTDRQRSDVRKAESAAGKFGVKIKIFAGNNITVDGDEARGYFDGDTIYVRADHGRFSAYQIARHELGHYLLSRGVINTAEIKKAIEEKGISEVANLYLTLYDGTGLSEDEIWDEIVCDALGELNVFSGTPAAKETRNLLSAVRDAAFGSMTEENLAKADSAFKESKKEAKASREIDAKNIDKANTYSEEIRSSMSMEQAKQMVQRAFALAGIKEYYEGEYTDGYDWLKKAGADEVAMYVENEYTLQEKYLNKIPAYIDGDISVEEILNAYLDGQLTGMVTMAQSKRLDTSRSTGYSDSRFYAPKSTDAENAKELYDTANQKITKSNKASVTEARAKILFLAHDANAAESIGISNAELNKKLRTWGAYPAKAIDITNRINRGVAPENRWTGIQNCSILNKQTVSDEDILQMVKGIEGTSDEYKRAYIGRTMLALDTHINWGNLTFEFKSGGFEHSRSTRGMYSKDRISVANSGYANTVAHEMGHALDSIWGREIFGKTGSGDLFLSDTAMRPDLIQNEDARQFYYNFRSFIDSITDSSDIRSSYTQDAKEVFARFVAKFVEFADATAGNRFYQESSWYSDRFTASQYIEFARLLQEKAMLDASGAVKSFNVSDNGTRSQSENRDRMSLELVPPVNPTSDAWERGATTDEVRAAHPTLYAVDEEATEERNPTQVKGTIGSYRKVYNILRYEGFDGTILDASSGLGYGTEAGRSEYGFNVDDIEPYPDSDYSPKYTDYSKLKKKYDVIISNAVLNVIPQDQRDALVVKMGQLLKDGGRMFINVRGKDVLNSSGKIAINENLMEYFIPRTAKTGSYQKGFTANELKAYLEDALGDGYTVEKTNKFGAVSAIVTKGGTKLSREEPEALNALVRENERLQKKLAEAKRQVMMTTEPTFTDRTIASASNRLIRTVGSNMKAEEIKPRIKEFFEYMANDPTNEGMQERAYDIARELVDNTEEMVGADIDLYNRMVGYLKDNKLFLSKDYRSDVNYKEFTKKNPKVKMSSNGLPVDIAYQELQEIFGEGFFPTDVIHPADQLEQIADVLDSLKPFYRNPYSLEMAQAYNWAANAVIDEYFDAKEAPATFADKAAKKLEAQANKYEQKLITQQANYEDALTKQEADYGAELARQKEDLTANYEDRLTKQEADYEAEIERRRQNAAFMVKAAVAKEKRLRDEKIDALKEHYQSVNERKRELKQERNDREKLRKIVKRLQSKKIDPVTKSMLPAIVKELDATAVNLTDKSVEKLSELRQWYKDKTTEGSDIFDPNFIPDKATIAKLDRLEKAMNGKTIGQMTILEVRELTEVLQNIEHQMHEGKNFQQSKVKKDNYEAGLRTIQDIENARPGKINRELSPQRAARRIAGYNDGAIEGTEASPLITLMDETVEGERKTDLYQRDALRTFKKWLDDKDFMRGLYGRKAKEIMITGVDSRTGETRNVAITPAMRISLYLHSMNDDNMRHIQEGGVVIPAMNLYKKGKAAEAYAADIRVKLTKTNVAKICDGMSEMEKRFANVVWRYFNEYAPKRLNEASVLIDGYEKFNVENYFPISVDSNFLSQDYESVIMEQDGSLTHPGFGEERIQSAKPIYLRDVNDVFMTALRTNSMYACQAVPLMNLSKLINVQQVGAVDSVTAALNRKFTASKMNPVGTSASDYLSKYMRDYAGNKGGKKSGTDKLLAKVRSNYSGGVLTLAAGTAIKQAASYPTAAAVTSTRSLIQAMNPARTVNTAFIDKRTAAFTKRTEGLSTVELAEMTQEGKAIPKALNWIQAVDVGTTALLKRAAAIEIQRTTNLQLGTEEYEKAVTDLYIKIIEETQPNYSVALRPDILRSDSALERALVMFATQPMQNFGILYDAIGDYRAKSQAYAVNKSKATENAKKAAGKKLGKAIGSQLSASLVFALMQFAYDAFRKKDDKYKDDGEMTLLSFLKGIGINMLSNGAGMLIAGKVALELGETVTDKIIKAFGGDAVFNSSVYGFEVAELSAITDAATSVINAAGAITTELYKAIDKDKDTSVNIENLARKTWAAAEDALVLFGIPLQNATTTLTSAAKQICTAAMGKYVGDYYALRISNDPSSSKKVFYDNLFACWQNGGSATTRELYNQMLSDGFNADDIKSAMESRQKEREGVKSVKDLKTRWTIK